MPQSQPHSQNYKGLAWVAAMALFMQSLDATILNTALPSIATDLHEPAFEMQMAIIAYSLSVALFIPLTAWAATITAFIHIIAKRQFYRFRFSTRVPSTLALSPIFLSAFLAQVCHFCYHSCSNFHLVIVQKCRVGYLHRLH